MTLTITNWWWLIPTILTAIVWIRFIFFHEKSTNRGFNLDGLEEGFTAVVVSLLSWLIYFIIF